MTLVVRVERVVIEDAWDHPVADLSAALTAALTARFARDPGRAMDRAQAAHAVSEAVGAVVAEGRAR